MSSSLFDSDKMPAGIFESQRRRSSKTIRIQAKGFFPMHSSDYIDKPQIVQLILNQKTEMALSALAKHYTVSVPKLKIGLPKGHKRNLLGCYTPRNQTISLLNSDAIGNPFVVLHEFYHHTRTSIDKKHRGTERNADKFASEFIKEYKAALNR